LKNLHLNCTATCQADQETELNIILLAALALKHMAPQSKYFMLLNNALTAPNLPWTYNRLSTANTTKAAYAPFIADFASLMTVASMSSWVAQVDYYK